MLRGDAFGVDSLVRNYSSFGDVSRGLVFIDVFCNARAPAFASVLCFAGGVTPSCQWNEVAYFYPNEVALSPFASSLSAIPVSDSIDGTRDAMRLC